METVYTGRTATLLLVLSVFPTLVCAIGGDDLVEFQRLAVDKDPEKRIDAIEKIRDLRNLQSTKAIALLLADPHPKVRHRAVKALAMVEEKEPVTWLIADGLRAKQDDVRVGIVQALAMMKEPSAVDPLLGLLKDDNPIVRAEALGALAQIPDAARGHKAIVDHVARESVWLPKAEGIVCAVALNPAHSWEIVKNATDDRHYQVRLAAAEALPFMESDERCALLENLVNDKEWPVRVAAIEACARINLPIGVGYLVDRLPKEQGRLRGDILMALKRLTGQELGLDAKAWKTWWEQNRASFRPAGSASKAKKPKGGDDATEVEEFPAVNDKTVVQFLDLPVLSDRVAFVIDLSGSMRDKVNEKDEDEEPDAKTKTRLDVAKREMIGVIGAFAERVYFNIFLLGSDRDGRYDRQKKVWSPQLVPAGVAGKTAAVKFLERQTARGWTNIYDAVLFAFEDPNVDTVYLYSDGGASRGIFVATEEIVRHIQKMNKYRKIAVHAIEIEAKARGNKRLMRELAAATGGAYIAK